MNVLRARYFALEKERKRYHDQIVVPIKEDYDKSLNALNRVANELAAIDSQIADVTKQMEIESGNRSKSSE